MPGEGGFVRRDGVDRALEQAGDVDPGPLGRVGAVPVPAAESEAAGELAAQCVHLGASAAGPLVVVPRLRFVEFGAQVGQPRPVGRLRLRVENRADPALASSDAVLGQLGRLPRQRRPTAGLDLGDQVRDVELPAGVAQQVVGSPRGISPLGSHGTERDSLPSFRSSHPIHENARIHAQ